MLFETAQQLKLPSAPPKPIIVYESDTRPQPRLDRDIGGVNLHSHPFSSSVMHQHVLLLTLQMKKKRTFSQTFCCCYELHDYILIVCRVWLLQ